MMSNEGIRYRLRIFLFNLIGKISIFSMVIKLLNLSQEEFILPVILISVFLVITTVFSFVFYF